VEIYLQNPAHLHGMVLNQLSTGIITASSDTITATAKVLQLRIRLSGGICLSLAFIIYIVVYITTVTVPRTNRRTIGR
jgi:hypothetical protein